MLLYCIFNVTVQILLDTWMCIIMLNANKIKQAEQEAEKILEEAHLAIEAERAKMLREAQNEISDIIVSATEKIIVSSTSESFEQFLNAVERGGEGE